MQRKCFGVFRVILYTHIWGIEEYTPQRVVSGFSSILAEDELLKYLTQAWRANCPDGFFNIPKLKVFCFFREA